MGEDVLALLHPSSSSFSRDDFMNYVLGGVVLIVVVVVVIVLVVLPLLHPRPRPSS